MSFWSVLLQKGKRASRPVSQFSWLQYVLVIGVMGALTVLPALMFGGATVIAHTGQFVFWYILYWAAVALIFCLVTAWQKYNAFDKPMRLLGEAAKKVAEGDFSVYIKPLHAPKAQSYVDFMFSDFNKMVEELGSLETMKNDFVSNVSHEFKTPLATVQNYATALKDPEMDEATRQEYLDVIIDSANNLSAMITNVLRLNKVENQVIPPNRKPFDLCAQLANCMIAYEEPMDAKDLEMVAELEDELILTEDASLLELVWNNLLSNAVKFSKPGGAVELRQSSDAHTVTVSVSDTGCGMSAETQKHIFDKFYQGDTSHSQQGNGLGLALAKRVVELCGGSITLASVVDKGTTFTVVLPRSSPEKS